jgi:uncharacterized membrane protein
MGQVTGRRDGRLPLDTRVALLAGVVLAASFALQVLVFSGGHPLGDVPGRYVVDGVRPGRLPYLSAPVEYPAGNGVAMWVASLVSTSAGQFLVVTSALTAGAAVVLVRLLQRRAPTRVACFVLAPALFLYAFHNWDVLALVPAVAGVLAFERGEDRKAGVLLGLGAAIKLFPGFFLIPFAVARMRAGRRGTARMLVAAAAVVAAINLPIMLLSASGWAYPLRFQGARKATWGTIWPLVLELPGVRHAVGGDRVGAANVLSLVALAAGLALVARVAWKRPVAPAALAAAALIEFLLSNKVYSPNYDVWLAAFFPLVAWSAGLRRTLGAITVAVFVAVFGAFHGFLPMEVPAAIVPVLALARACVLVMALRVALRQGPEPARRLTTAAAGARVGR